MAAWPARAGARAATPVRARRPLDGSSAAAAAAAMAAHPRGGARRAPPAAAAAMGGGRSRSGVGIRPGGRGGRGRGAWPARATTTATAATSLSGEGTHRVGERKRRARTVTGGELREGGGNGTQPPACRAGILPHPPPPRPACPLSAPGVVEAAVVAATKGALASYARRAGPSCSAVQTGQAAGRQPPPPALFPTLMGQPHSFSLRIIPPLPVRHPTPVPNNSGRAQYAPSAAGPPFPSPPRPAPQLSRPPAPTHPTRRERRVTPPATSYQAPSGPPATPPRLPR